MKNAFAEMQGFDPGDIKKKRILVVWGQEAVQERFAKCEKSMTKVVDAADSKFFRTFRWCLSSEEDNKIEEWQQILVMTAKDRLSEARAKALKDVDNLKL